MIVLPAGILPCVEEMEILKLKGLLPPGIDLPITHTRPDLFINQDLPDDDLFDDDGFY